MVSTATCAMVVNAGIAVVVVNAGIIAVVVVNAGNLGKLLDIVEIGLPAPPAAIIFMALTGAQLKFGAAGGAKRMALHQRG